MRDMECLGGKGGWSEKKGENLRWASGGGCDPVQKGAQVKEEEGRGGRGRDGVWLRGGPRGIEGGWDEVGFGWDAEGGYVDKICLENFGYLYCLKYVVCHFECTS